jgi:4-cresol dehydrogenase (hydroxylating) flavoprotein subunit
VKLTLPPRVSPTAFNAALKAYSAVVGKDWVMASDADRDAYSDIYAPGPESEWPSSAAVAPATTEEVQAVVRLANEHKTPLWPVSRGKNLGYGANAPRMPGSIVLDLGRMTKIHELNTELGYTVIEPGVGYGCRCPAMPGAPSSATRSIMAWATRLMASMPATCAASKLFSPKAI